MYVCIGVYNIYNYIHVHMIHMILFIWCLYIDTHIHTMLTRVPVPGLDILDHLCTAWYSSFLRELGYEPP